MKKILSFLILVCILTIFLDNSQQIIQAKEKILPQISIVKNPYMGDRRGPEFSQGPQIIHKKGLIPLIKAEGFTIGQVFTVQLTTLENKEYGSWNRMGIANNHLKEYVAKGLKQDSLIIGLLNNCTSLLGMLGGMQSSGAGWKPIKVGLVWIDAHGDYNTPETTLSGMLGGMPVAVAAGHCLHNLRLRSGLKIALPERYIVMAGVRDTDPLEQWRIDNSEIQMIPTQNLKSDYKGITEQLERLSKLTDIIYVHIDMDVLDPKEVRGHSLTVPDGPSSLELAGALAIMFQFPKVKALGIASYPWQDDKDLISLKAVYNLIQGALMGIKKREGS